MLTWVMLLIGDEQLPSYMGVSKNRGGPPKMDGEDYNGTPSFLKWMIWGENLLFSETSIWISHYRKSLLNHPA